MDRVGGWGGNSVPGAGWHVSLWRYRCSAQPTCIDKVHLAAQRCHPVLVQVQAQPARMGEARQTTWVNFVAGVPGYERALFMPAGLAANNGTMYSHPSIHPLQYTVGCQWVIYAASGGWRNCI